MQLYKSSPSQKGCGFSASFNGIEKCVFFSVIKQSAWDATRKTGSFAGAKTVVKLSLSEVGSILDVIARNVEFSAYHKSQDAVTQIWLKPYLVKATDSDQQIQKGFGLSISQEKNGFEKINWLMPFSWADMRLLEHYLGYFLRVVFSIEEAENKKKYKEKTAKKQTEISVDESPLVL